MKRLEVYLNWGNDFEIPVGELADQNHRIYFQYHRDFPERNLWLSPYKLPPGSGLLEHRDREFGPLFGLFDDSLPDGWGRLLMDRYMKGKGFTIEKLSPLDRLSFLGSHTMGALCYRPVLEGPSQDERIFDLYKLYDHSQKILKGESQSVLKELMLAGGSPGGARPKVLVGVNKEKMISGEGDLPDDYHHWIIKFDGNSDNIDSGSVEYAYSLMAKDCGIAMTETRMFEIEGGKRFFGIKRFDREENRRFHTHTFGNLIHSDFRIPSCDYRMFFRVVLDLTKKQQELKRAFRQMIFNIFTHNRDDHVKNFTFLMNREGEWFLSPAYDLTFSQGPGGEHSMTVDGEGRFPTAKNIHRLGESSGLKKQEVSELIEEVLQSVSRWPEYAEKAGVGEEAMEKIRNEMTIPY
ncbi:MAG: type II toxin-antitoxin system HipA family toxin [Spirochaetales bacterium]|nr:type II toxin-antitoxin system HipA family toxin [Spirochaetales bacterium]